MTPTAEMLLQSPCTSDALRAALVAALRRDPVDALADAETLRAVLRARLAALFASHADGAH